MIDFDMMWKWICDVKRDKKHTPAILFSSAKFTPCLQMSNFKEYKYSWIWKKNIATNFLNANKMPLRSVESINVFYDKLPLYNPQKTTGHKPANNYTKHGTDGELYGKVKVGISGGGQTDRYPRDVLTFPSDKQKLNLHSTQKPLDLLRYMIRTYTNEGDTVLDFTAGSCSLSVAAYLEGRNSVCIEMDTEQYNKSFQWVLNCTKDDPYKIEA